jgi:hypothetical protein
VEQAYTEAVQLDLTSESSRTITYKIDDSWLDLGADDVIIQESDSLVPYVIVGSTK